MRARVLFPIMAAATIAAAIVVACGEPYGGNDSSAQNEGGADVVNAPLLDATSTDDAPPIPSDDAASRGDATALVDAASCTTCDCDNDTYNRAGCVDAGVDAGPVDCDDLDPLRHPGQAYLTTPPPAGQSPPGDWDCNDSVERFYTTGVSCSSLMTVACNGVQGLTTNPGCGVVGTFVTCHVNGLACAVETSQSRFQRCK
jgi:hypothetical protein